MRCTTMYNVGNTYLTNIESRTNMKAFIYRTYLLFVELKISTTYPLTIKQATFKSKLIVKIS